MTTDSENLFYEATADLGGRPDAVYHQSALAVLMDHFTRIATPSLPAHIYWNYIGSTEVNAVALVHRQREIIGINVGTILVIYDLFLSLLAQPSFAPDIGTPSQTTGTWPAVAERIACATRGSYSSLNNLQWLIDRPQDPVRQSYAWALSHCALDFILQHELAHLEMGHLEYLENRKSIGKLFERRAQDGSMWDMDVSQACETDADRAAVGIALSRLRRIQAQHAESEPSTGFLDMLRQERYSYRAWHTAIGMLFFVFGLEDVGLGVDAERSHPHPHLRHLMSYHVGLLDTREDDPGCETAYQDGFNMAIIDSVGAWLEMVNRDFVIDFLGTSTDLERVWHKLMTRTTRVWKDIEEATHRRRTRIYGSG